VCVGGFKVILRDLRLLLLDGSEQEVTEIAEVNPPGAAPVQSKLPASEDPEGRVSGDRASLVAVIFPSPARY